MFSATQKLQSFMFALIIISSNAAFASIEDDYLVLKDSGKNFEVTGTICEEVARLRMAEQFREPEYKVVTGIAYGDGSRTIGELDVIVFNADDKVVKVGEVKCWRNMASGLKKAKEQRARFLKAIKNNHGLKFVSTSTKEVYRPAQFKGINDFISIAQQGSTSVGFDMELDSTLSSLMELRGRIMQCQNSGQCEAVSH